MKLSRIAKATKPAGCYSIFIDGHYRFSLSDSALLASGLSVGRELTEAELTRWQQRSRDDERYQKALRYAALRPRSKWEVESYLKRADTSPALTTDILDRLQEISLLDDERFAHSLVRSRALLHPTSKRKLQQELRAKHVSDNIVRRVLSEEISDDAAPLRDLITKKRRLPRYQGDDRRLIQYLIRQGFDYEDVMSALRETASGNRYRCG